MSWFERTAGVNGQVSVSVSVSVAGSLNRTANLGKLWSFVLLCT
jgi:hypothetical protein